MPARALRRSISLCATAVLVTLAAGCGDDGVSSDAGDPAAQVATMRLVVGNQTVTVRRSDGAVTGGPIAIGPGTTTLTATFLDGSGSPVTGLGDLELQITPANAAQLTFTRTSAFGGTLNRLVVAPATTQINVQLWHQDERHADFGPFNLQVSLL